MAPIVNLIEQFKTTMHHQIDSIRDINRKYKTPRLKMTRGVKLSLLGIRIYLIILLSILLYRFITLIT
jgi:hypothetical protein